MSTFANQLKSEISRLAKKEVRAEVQALKKASANYRSEIVALKKRLASLETQIKKQTKGKMSAAASPSEDGEGASLRFRVEGFASLRKKLGLSAANMGKLLGVSAQSVYHWETGKSKPRASQLQASLLLARWARKPCPLNWPGRVSLNPFRRLAVA